MATLDSTDEIRRRLSPERLTPERLTAPNRPHVRLWVDDGPGTHPRAVVAYPPPPIDTEGLDAFVALVRQQRDACRRLAALRPGGRWERHALIGLPTAAERRERLDRALARLRQGNLVTVRRAVGR